MQTQLFYASLIQFIDLNYAKQRRTRNLDHSFMLSVGKDLRLQLGFLPPMTSLP